MAAQMDDEMTEHLHASFSHARGGASAEDLLLSAAQHHSLQDFKLDPRLLPTWHGHAQLQARVVARVVAACLTRPIVTITDLEREIAAAERVHSYADLGLGRSLQQLAVAQRYFSLVPNGPPVRPTTSDEVLRYYTTDAAATRVLFLSAMDLADGFALSVGRRKGYQCGIHIQNLPQLRVALQTEAARFPSALVQSIQAFARAMRQPPASVRTQQPQQQQQQLQPQPPTINSGVVVTKASLAYVAPAAAASRSLTGGNLLGSSSGLSLSGLFGVRAAPPKPKLAATPLAQAAQEETQQQIGWPRAAAFFDSVYGPGSGLAARLTDWCSSSAAATAVAVGGASDVVGWQQWNRLERFAAGHEVMCPLFGAFLAWFAATRLPPIAIPQAQDPRPAAENAAAAAAAVKDRPRRYRPPMLTSSATTAPEEQQQQQQEKQQQDDLKSALRSLDAELGAPTSIVCVDVFSADVPAPHRLLPLNASGNSQRVVLFCASEEERRRWLKRIEKHAAAAFSSPACAVDESGGGGDASPAAQAAAAQWVAQFLQAFPIHVLSAPIKYFTASMERALAAPIVLGGGGDNSTAAAPAPTLQFLPLSSCFAANPIFSMPLPPMPIVTVGRGVHQQHLQHPQQQPDVVDPGVSRVLYDSLLLSMQALRLVLKQRAALKSKTNASSSAASPITPAFFETIDVVMAENIVPLLEVLAVNRLSVAYRCLLPGAAVRSGGGDEADDRFAHSTVMDTPRCLFDAASCCLFVSIAEDDPHHNNTNGGTNKIAFANRIRGNVVADALADGIIDLLRNDPFMERALFAPGDEQRPLPLFFEHLRALTALRPLLVEHFTWSLFLDPGTMNFECRARGLLGGDAPTRGSNCSEEAAKWGGGGELLGGAATAMDGSAHGGGGSGLISAIPLSGKVYPHFPITAGGTSGVPLIPDLERAIAGPLVRQGQPQHQQRSRREPMLPRRDRRNDVGDDEDEGAPRMQQTQRRQRQEQEDGDEEEDRDVEDNHNSDNDDQEGDVDSRSASDDTSAADAFALSMNAALANPGVSRTMQQKRDSKKQRFGGVHCAAAALEAEQRRREHAQFTFQQPPFAGSASAARTVDFASEQVMQSRVAEHCAFEFLRKFCVDDRHANANAGTRQPFWFGAARSGGQQYRLVSVEWCNAQGEQGLPYDLVETYLVTDTGGGSKYERHYVDVKSTSAAGARGGGVNCHISLRELVFASANPDRFHIISVSGLDAAVDLSRRLQLQQQGGSRNTAQSEQQLAKAFAQCSLRRVQAPLQRWNGGAGGTMGGAASGGGGAVRLDGQIVMQVSGSSSSAAAAGSAVLRLQ